METNNTVPAAAFFSKGDPGAHPRDPPAVHWRAPRDAPAPPGHDSDPAAASDKEGEPDQLQPRGGEIMAEGFRRGMGHSFMCCCLNSVVYGTATHPSRFLLLPTLPRVFSLVALILA